MILEKEDIQLVADMTGLSCANAKDYIDKIYKDLEDDQVTFDDILDVVECEIKVKENNIKNVVQSDKKKISKPKTVVVSDEKIALFDILYLFHQNNKIIIYKHSFVNIFLLFILRIIIRKYTVLYIGDLI